jgi:hypothetical protein
MIKKWIFAFILMLVSPFSSHAATCSTVTYYAGQTRESVSIEITYTFDQAYTCGQFVNGDWWVVGPVKITAITPAYSDGQNGWMVNPSVVNGGTGAHGFTVSATGFNAALVPPLSYTSATGIIESIVKSVTTTTNTLSGYESFVKASSVLTILTEAPANNGATVFRPPFTGTDKPLYNVGDLNLTLLPSGFSNATANAPTLATVATSFTPFRMDFFARHLRPTNAMYDYTPQNTPVTNEAMLRLMMNDDRDSAGWKDAMYKFTQYSIDTAHAAEQGFRKVTGHSPGYPPIAAWSATLLPAMSDIKTALAAITDWTDFAYTGSQETTTGEVLWGQTNTELAYWTYISAGTGNRSNMDPYGYIDGGKCGVEYQDINSQAYKGDTLIFQLAPQMQSSVNNVSRLLLANYAERWVATGVWSQPDPCAPYVVGGVYGTDYGPDAADLGHCIHGDGRYPDKHGTLADTGDYKSTFVASMWDAYYYDATAPTVTAFTIPATSASLTVAVTFTTSDAVGVTGWMIKETNSAPLSGDAGWSATVLTSYTFATPGAKNLYAWAKDAAGNVSTNAASHEVDTDATTITLTVPSIVMSGTGTVTMGGTGSITFAR